MNLKVKAQKWGNSLGMRIPKAIVEVLDLDDGTLLELEVAGDDLVVRSARQYKYNLKVMLAQVNSKNIHKESGDACCPVGEEFW